MRGRTRSLGALALVAAIAFTACTDDEPPPPISPTGATPTTGPSGSPSPPPSITVTPSPTASPTVEPSHLELPADAPITLADPQAITSIAAGDFTPLVPPGATVAFADALTDPFPQIAVAWERGDDPFAAERGFVVWQTAGDGGTAWRAVYAFTDPPRKEVLGIQRPQRGDLTGDGVDELVTFEDRGGSGACGTTRVISPVAGAADEIYRRATCDAQTSIVGSTLQVREAVFAPDDPHCCPSAFRTTTLEWDGDRFVETDVVEEPTA